MTVSTTTSKVSYAGNGSTVAFAVNFYFLANADIKVVLRAANGTETVKTLNTDYTVTGAGVSSGGTVTMVTAPASGQTLVIARNAPLTQLVDYQPNDPFPATTHEQALDKLTMIVQQQQEQLDRSAKLPISSTADADTLSAAILQVADDQTNIDAVAADLANIDAVAGDLTNIDTAAANIAAINAAPAAAASASASASAAATSAAAAAAAVASGMYSAVQDKSADYTVVAGDAGDLLRINTSGGARTITLPLISTVSDGFKVAIVKWTSDGNPVNIARSGNDTINGATSTQIGAQYSQTTFVADFETNQWFAALSGLGTSNVTVDVFSGNGSTTAFTLSGEVGSKNNTAVMISGVYQAKSTYSLSGTTLTFSTAPPSGTSNIEVVWNAPLAIGTPSDGTVSTAKMADQAVTRAKAANELLGVAQNAQSSNYTLALTDIGQHIYSTNSGAQTITIPTNASVAFPVGAAITLVNNGTTAITISTTSITLYQAGTANTGNRTLATKGVATLLKVATDTWFVSGAGLT